MEKSWDPGVVILFYLGHANTYTVWILPYQAWQYSYPQILPTYSFSYTHILGSIHEFNERQTLCVLSICVRVCVCLCMWVLSGRPANTLSQGGSLIYRASNEGQQRRRATTSLRLIVCLFTFTFLIHPLPPSVTWRRRRTWLEISSMCKVSTKQSNQKQTSLKVISAPSVHRFNTVRYTGCWSMWGIW